MNDTNPKSGKELADERVEAMKRMTPAELAASIDGLAEAAYEDREAAMERAAWRKEMRRRQN